MTDDEPILKVVLSEKGRKYLLKRWAKHGVTNEMLDRYLINFTDGLFDELDQMIDSSV